MSQPRERFTSTATPAASPPARTATPRLRGGGGRRGTAQRGSAALPCLGICHCPWRRATPKMQWRPPRDETDSAGVPVGRLRVGQLAQSASRCQPATTPSDSLRLWQRWGTGRACAAVSHRRRHRSSSGATRSEPPTTTGGDGRRREKSFGMVRGNRVRPAVQRNLHRPNLVIAIAHSVIRRWLHRANEWPLSVRPR